MVRGLGAVRGTFRPDGDASTVADGAFFAIDGSARATHAAIGLTDEAIRLKRQAF